MVMNKNKNSKRFSSSGFTWGATSGAVGREESLWDSYSLPSRVGRGRRSPTGTWSPTPTLFMYVWRKARISPTSTLSLDERLATHITSKKRLSVRAS